MSYVTGADLLKQFERTYHEEEVPGLGLCRFRNLTEREYAAYEVSISDPENGRFNIALTPVAKVRLVGLCLVDGDGARILSDADAEKLADTQPAATINRLHDICLRLNSGAESLKKKLNDSPTNQDGDS